MSATTKRLTIDISPQQHRRLKTLASFYGVTMKEFLLSRSLPEARSKKGQDAGATDYLLESQKNRERLLASIRRNRKGNRTFTSLKALKHALGV